MSVIGDTGQIKLDNPAIRQQDRSQFWSAAKRLANKRFSPDTESESRVNWRRYAGGTTFDYTQTAPSFDNLGDANEFIGKLWEDSQRRLKRLQELAERGKQSSSNSSKPPSTDNLSEKAKRHEANKKLKSKRRRGAQPGHVGKGRSLLPIEQVDEVRVCEAPTTCLFCAVSLLPPKITRRKQIFSLSSKRLTVTEYQLQKTRCPSCHRVFRSRLPEGLPRGMFDESVISVISALGGRYRLSKANIRACLFDLYGLSISVGSISNAEKNVSEALEGVADEILTALREAPLKHIDETTYYEQHRLRWLWVITNNQYAYFKLTKTRKGEVAKALLGEANAVDQRIVSDRYGAYHYLNSRCHQYCLAHLDRNLKGVIGREDPFESKVGEQLKQAKGRLLREFKGKANPRVIKRELRAFRQGLRAGLELIGTPTAGLCHNLIKGFRKLWNFLVDPMFPQTNNLAERMLRHNVLWRRVNHGTQSERGNEYVERISTVQMTCRLQGRNLLAFLKEAVQAHWLGKDPPSLLVSD